MRLQAGLNPFVDPGGHQWGQPKMHNRDAHGTHQRTQYQADFLPGGLEQPEMHGRRVDSTHQRTHYQADFLPGGLGQPEMHGRRVDSTQ